MAPPASSGDPHAEGDPGTVCSNRSVVLVIGAVSYGVVKRVESIERLEALEGRFGAGVRYSEGAESRLLAEHF